MQRRQQILADSNLRGVRLTRSLCQATDEWLQSVWQSANEAVTISKRAALVAVGGYGRGNWPRLAILM